VGFLCFCTKGVFLTVNLQKYERLLNTTYGGKYVFIRDSDVRPAGRLIKNLPVPLDTLEGK
jgi:hypothetical protein